MGNDQRIKDIMIIAILILAITAMTNVGVASAVTAVSSCGTLSTPGETYILNNDIATTGTCFTITADGITLDGAGYTIMGDGTGFGVILSGRTGVMVKNISVNNFNSGIFLSSSNSNTITGNTASNSADLSRGISLYSSNSNTITGNTVSGNYVGIDLFSSNSNTITGNTAHGNVVGIGLVYSSGNNVTSNTASNNTTNGIQLSASSGNTIIGNTVLSNRQEGINVYFSDDNSIRGNIVSNTVFSGIVIHTSNSNTITGNTVSNNNAGIVVAYSSSNEIYNNNFIDNPTQVFINGGTGNNFNLAAPTGGNYWSNYDTPVENCNDTNNDGFCDSPFVFTGGQDNLPWTTPSGWEVPTDNTLPVITLLGITPIGAECGFTYTDAGATASDNVDGDLTSNMLVNNPVNIAVLGTYTVTYNVSDAAGNAADTATRTVNVVDTTAPTVTAALVPFGNGDDDEGKFIVSISSNDICEPSPIVTADINGVPVSDGQPVKLEIADETESNTKSFTEKQCAKFQEQADEKTAKGKPIPDSLQFNLLICQVGSVLQMEGPSFTLTATATDSSGNSSTAISSPTFVAEDD